jgi:hypothetical protein
LARQKRGVSAIWLQGGQRRLINPSLLNALINSAGITPLDDVSTHDAKTGATDVLSPRICAVS